MKNIKHRYFLELWPALIKQGGIAAFKGDAFFDVYHAGPLAIADDDHWTDLKLHRELPFTSVIRGMCWQ
jgi:hypothetical protein